MPTRLGFAGDVMLGRLVDERQRGAGRMAGRRPRPPEAVWGDLLSDLRDLDAFFVNLECTLSTSGRQWRRTYRPFHFRADPDWAVPALERAGVRYASLANNHLLDYEEPALLDTLAALDGVDIAHAGAGPDRVAARAPAWVDVGDLRIGFVAFTDNTPEYAATDDRPGVAHLGMDPDDPADRRVARAALDRARERDPDCLVASLHWGPNMVTEPAANHEAFGRFLVGEGVDLIHGHSAHVVQGIEVVDGAPICYDMGDFVDDYRVDPALRNDRSFLFEATIDDGRLTRLRLRPVEIRDCAVTAAPEDAAAWCRETMRERSADYDTDFARDGADLVLDLG